MEVTGSTRIELAIWSDVFIRSFSTNILDQSMSILRKTYETN